jgi:hydrogenase maturation protease
MSESALGEVLVIGLGNPLMGDDGLGLAALERLGRRWRLPETVRLVDGGTWGLNLLPLVEGADRVIFLDAIDAGEAFGALVQVEREDVPRFLALKLSPHQIDLREVLALAELRGTLPSHLVAIGLQPGRLEMGCGLSPEIQSRLDAVLLATVKRLQSWGYVCNPLAIASGALAPPTIPWPPASQNRLTW